MQNPPGLRFTLNALAGAIPGLVATVIALSSLSFKSGRSNATAAWADGANWWVGLGFFGGLAIVVLMVWGVTSNRLFLASLIAIPTF